ncbi:dynamin family protein [Actinomycetospora cinnamomea]|uniref:Dynamin family protein n=1 Tax=Actinomycetospora cinnamomea TaxID=663609 RepID=A0A2U1FG27_9PSEU|nr:dynamin family protein [Actinomycetospora cinnamomea]PVZ11109.1 dynamin family protein [Actinomycetospora cinnamomea]
MGPLRSAVVATCRALAPRVSLPTADVVEAVAARMLATPSLVVAGPVSSGKSTLVNALVGRRVAPTGAGECTGLTAHYVRGPADRLDVVLTDGTRRPLPLAADGRVPAAVGDRLGVRVEDVDHLLVTLTSAALDGLTVIDTPGTGSARRRGGPAGGPAGGSRADAALVVLPATAHAGDLDVLPGPAAHGPAGVVAVLGRADTVGPDDGRELAVALGRRLGDRVGPVTPVIGLLAETAVTGALRAEDVGALRVLAGADPAVLEVALLDAELFTTAELPLPVEVRARLLELLDLRGLALGLALLRADAAAGVGELCEALLAASGLATLVGRLRDEVRARTDLHAATAGVRELTELGEALARAEAQEASADTGTDTGTETGAGRSGEGIRVADAAAALARREAFTERALLAARARLWAGALGLPAELLDEVDRLAAPAPPDVRLGRAGAGAVELAGHAARRAAWWRAYGSWGSPRRIADLAHVVHRTYAGLWRDLTVGRSA